MIRFLSLLACGFIAIPSHAQTQNIDRDYHPLGADSGIERVSLHEVITKNKSEPDTIDMDQTYFVVELTDGTRDVIHVGLLIGSEEALVGNSHDSKKISLEDGMIRHPTMFQVFKGADDQAMLMWEQNMYLMHGFTPSTRPAQVPSQTHVASVGNPATLHRSFVELTNATFAKAVSQKGIVLVEYGAKWCAPCQALKARMKKIQAAKPDMKIYTVDVENSPELANSIGEAIPVTAIYKDGIKIFENRGSENDKLESELQP